MAEFDNPFSILTKMTLTKMTASDSVQPALTPLWQGADGASGRVVPPRVTDDRELEFSSFNGRKIAPVSHFRNVPHPRFCDIICGNSAKKA